MLQEAYYKNEATKMLVSVYCIILLGKLNKTVNKNTICLQFFLELSLLFIIFTYKCQEKYFIFKGNRAF